MLSHLPDLRLDGEGVTRVMTGRDVKGALAGVNDEGRFLRLCDERGALVAVGAYDAEAEVVRPRVVLEGKS
jgi:hypothetical protein